MPAGGRDCLWVVSCSVTVSLCRLLLGCSGGVADFGSFLCGFCAICVEILVIVIDIFSGRTSWVRSSYHMSKL